MTHSENPLFPSSESGSRVRGNGPDESAAASQLHRQLSTARQKMADTMVAMQDRSQHAVETATGTIQRWPFTAIALAIGVGIALGYLLADRSSLGNYLRRSSTPQRWHW